MRLLMIPLALLLLFGCSSKSATSDEVVNKTGVITLKEVVDPESLKQGKTRTSVFGSVSSGGGVSIGLGFLLGSIGSGETKQNPVRYRAKLLDGSEVNFYHLSPDFEVGDCVEIGMHEDMEKHPPTMKRSPGDCI